MGIVVPISQIRKLRPQLGQCSPKVTPCKGRGWDSTEDRGAPKPDGYSLHRAVCSASLQTSWFPPTSLRLLLPAPCNWGRPRPPLPCSIFDHPPCSAEHASACLGEPVSFVLGAGRATVITSRTPLQAGRPQRAGLGESRAPQPSRSTKAGPSTAGTWQSPHLFVPHFLLWKMGPRRGPAELSGLTITQIKCLGQSWHTVSALYMLMISPQT